MSTCVIFISTRFLTAFWVSLCSFHMCSKNLSNSQVTFLYFWISMKLCAWYLTWLVLYEEYTTGLIWLVVYEEIIKTNEKNSLSLSLPMLSSEDNFLFHDWAFLLFCIFLIFDTMSFYCSFNLLESWLTMALSLLFPFIFSFVSFVPSFLPVNSYLTSI